jgi:hypothetical protein
MSYSDDRSHPQKFHKSGFQGDLSLALVVASLRLHVAAQFPLWSPKIVPDFHIPE